MAGDPLIELRDVDKYFGDLRVLRDVGLTVDRGEVVVVIGPSGSGRSTPCRAINRLETVRSGTLLLDGQPPKVMRFDEPTSAPDPEMINEVLEVMRQLAGEGMTVIVVTHGTGFARPAADRAVFTADGRIVEDRTSDGFLGDPRSDRAEDSPSEILEH